MNKKELCQKISEMANMPQKDVVKVLDAFTAAVKEAVAAGDKVQLIGFGNFEARKRNARTGKNPQTGEVINIPAAIVPAFKAGKAFKDAVNAAHEAEKPAKKGKKK